MAKNSAALAAFEHRSATGSEAPNRQGPKASASKATRRHREKPAKLGFDLRRIDPAAKPFSSGDKARDKAMVDAVAVELDALQDLFYADRRFKLLVVLQGTDTSGKDGTIRGVFGRMSALGVRAVGWKAPSLDERAHDFLWRIHARVPAAGEIVVFNRSHYEDVLVPVVDGSLKAADVQARFRAINTFERMLTDTGTVLLKFMLHVSKDEQRKRLQQRIDDPTKRWKFERGDIEVRTHWEAYQQAYAEAIDATGTAWAPWTVVPADSKTHRNLMIGNLLKRTLLDLKLRYPPDDPSLAGLRIE